MDCFQLDGQTSSGRCGMSSSHPPGIGNGQIGRQTPYPLSLLALLLLQIMGSVGLVV